MGTNSQDQFIYSTSTACPHRNIQTLKIKGSKSFDSWYDLLIFNDLMSFDLKQHAC